VLQISPTRRRLQRGDMSPPLKSQIGAVILAAGGSSRFGRPKQLILLRGKSLIRHIIDAACEAGCSPVVIVVGSDDEKLHRELDRACIVRVQNKQWQRGIGSSIRCGIRQLMKSAPDVEASLLLVCDQPAVDARVIERLIALRETTGKSIVASSYANTLGVPALFTRSVFGELLSLEDEAGAKSIILRNPERVAQFQFPEGEIDVDTWSDWQKLNQGGHPERSEGSHTS
jgi:molybdenum cofactor cytidylyltransferase